MLPTPLFFLGLPEFRALLTFVNVRRGVDDEVVVAFLEGALLALACPDFSRGSELTTFTMTRPVVELALSAKVSRSAPGRKVQLDAKK